MTILGLLKDMKNMQPFIKFAGCSTSFRGEDLLLERLIGQ
jgi:hypothetical protein